MDQSELPEEKHFDSLQVQSFILILPHQFHFLSLLLATTLYLYCPESFQGSVLGHLTSELIERP